MHCTLICEVATGPEPSAYPRKMRKWGPFGRFCSGGTARRRSFVHVFVADWTRNERVSYSVPSESPTAMLSVSYGLTRKLVVQTPVSKTWIPRPPQRPTEACVYRGIAISIDIWFCFEEFSST